MQSWLDPRVRVARSRNKKLAVHTMHTAVHTVRPSYPESTPAQTS